MKRCLSAIVIALSLASLGIVHAQVVMPSGSVKRIDSASVMSKPAKPSRPAQVEFKRIEGVTNLGKFRVGADGTMVKVADGPAVAGSLPSAWYDTNLVAGGDSGWYSSGLVEGFEYVGHGTGESAGTTVDEIEVYWVSDQTLVGDLAFLVLFYDGRDFDPNSPNTFVDGVQLTFNGLLPGLGGYSATVDLTGLETPIVIPNADFEYGYQLVSTNQTVFSTFFPDGFAGQDFGDPDGGFGATTAGISYCGFEEWGVNGQSPSEIAAGGPWWFGPGPPEVWAAPCFAVFSSSAAAVSIDSAYVIHNAFPGVDKVDAGKSLHKGTGTPTALTYNNLINTAQGINGVGFDVTGLAGTPTASDFDFDVSTDGSTWSPVGTAPSIAVTPGSPSQVAITWPNGTIMDTWLRITAKQSLGLAQDERYYLGHLRGEAGPTSALYSVSFGDIPPIRSAIGAFVGPSSNEDIDKNGQVSFADIAAMRGNIGASLTNISVP